MNFKSVEIINTRKYWLKYDMKNGISKDSMDKNKSIKKFSFT